MDTPQKRDIALLRHFFSHIGEVLPLHLLARQSGWKETEVSGRLRSFQEAGYPLEAWPQGGFRLLAPSDIWCAEEVLARAESPQIPGIKEWSPLFLAETTSTNDVAREALIRGVESGFFVVASRQTQGRGRQGRIWDSPLNGGLYFSMALRLDWPLADASRLTILSSVAAADAIEQLTGTRPQIKWPNDLYHAGNKLGGLLVETDQRAGHLVSAVIGIGINVRQSRDDFAPEIRALATSLRIITQETHRRMDLILAFLKAINRRWNEDFSKVREEWETSSLTLGQQVSLVTQNGLKIGQALGLNEQGALLFRGESGRVEAISSGEMNPLP